MLRIIQVVFRVIMRVALILPSVFGAFFVNAKNELSDQLSHITETNDYDNGLVLYQRINAEDLQELPDSALFDYHCLGAYYNSNSYLETANSEKVINHLLAAKRLREKSLGIHCEIYVEIMDALASEYISIGQYDEAMAICEEGIVKSMYEREVASQNFSALHLSLMECYEYLGWFNEIPKLLVSAWEFDYKVIDDVQSSYFPLWELRQFYHRYAMYDKALKISDEIESFLISKVGANHPEFSSVLYSKGGILNDMGCREEAISAYEQALSIALNNREYDPEIVEQIYGNLLIAYADGGLYEDCLKLLSSIRNYENSVFHPNFFETAIYTCAKHFADANHCHEAQSIIDMIAPEEISKDEVEAFDKLRKNIRYRLHVITTIDEIEAMRFHSEPGTSDWYNLSYELSDAYICNGTLLESLRVLEQMYDHYIKDPTNSVAYPLSLLENLMNITYKLEQYPSFLNYTRAKQKLLIEQMKGINDDAQVEIAQMEIMGNLNEIVVGQMKCHQLDGIDDNLNKLEAFYRNNYGTDSYKYAIYLHNRGRAFQLQNKFEEAKSSLLGSIQIQKKCKTTIMANTVKYYKEVIDALGEL